MDYQFIMQALEATLRDNQYTIQYLREERQKAEEKAAALIVANTELKKDFTELEAKIAELEDELSFYKPANCCDRNAEDCDKEETAQ